MNQQKPRLSKYTMGIGDRFAQQGEAQLAAFVEARRRNINVVPVWNKSNREHGIVGTEPASVRSEADAAVKALDWNEPYHVDADHIQRSTVDPYINSSDFFTIDVADSIGKAADSADIDSFVRKHNSLIGKISIPRIALPLEVSEEDVRLIARKFLLAIQEAGRVYRYIVSQRDADSTVFEVSIDETDKPQTPVDMLFILAAIADEGIPVQTIAPKFTGRFNKGVDYVGDVEVFTREFEEDLAVIAYAVEAFGLPANLKLSVHSGSDKFSIYEPIRQAIRKFDAGLHLKTAGTTWLEELIGLAESGPSGLAIAREVYASAFERFDELCGPYASVIDIDRSALPSPEMVNGWSGEQYADTLRHVPDHASFNPNVRQLLHVGYKVAAGMGDRYYEALRENREAIARNVTTNILDRHLLRIFG